MALRLVGAHIHHYRGIDDLRIPLGKVTVLVGRSGAGKSSILEALGFQPSEEGAFGRLADPRAVVSWYIEPDAKEREAIAVNLRSSIADLRGRAAVDADTVVAELSKWLVVERTAGPDRVAIDLFRWLIDVGERTRARRIKLVQTHSIPLRNRCEWLKTLLEAVESVPITPFVELPFLAADDGDLFPIPTSMVADPDDISPILFAHIQNLAAAAFGPIASANVAVESALTALQAGRLAPAAEIGIVGAILRALQEQIASRPLPLLQRLGSVQLVVQLGPDGPVGEAEALIASVQAELPEELAHLQLRLASAREKLRSRHESLDLHLESVVVGQHPVAEYPFSRLGKGSRRWVCGAIDEAARVLHVSWSSPEWSIEERHVALAARALPHRDVVRSRLYVRLIDDPVDGLEPRVHGEVMAWLDRQVEPNESLVLATAHASILKAARQSSRPVVIGVYRNGRTAAAVPLGPNLMAALEARASQLSTTPEELLFLARGVLLVEGTDDKDLIQAVYGEELATRGILLHALGGSSARQIALTFKNTAYGFLRLPTWVMLDSVPDETLAADARWAVRKGVSDNQVTLARARLPGYRLMELPFEPHDVGAGIALEVVRRAFRDTQRLPVADEAFTQMRRTTNASELKRLLLHWIYPTEALEAKDFSNRVIKPAADFISRESLGPEAASMWLRSSIERLFVELDDEEMTAAVTSTPV